mmetsp:Transcript_10546/g.13041  ORF Transcript_10546/g.13041 Transcript_10546/m.13041 type:complete len:126 (-) Transcript_10546:212-589(-)
MLSGQEEANRECDQMNALNVENLATLPEIVHVNTDHQEDIVALHQGGIAVLHREDIAALHQDGGIIVILEVHHQGEAQDDIEVQVHGEMMEAHEDKEATAGVHNVVSAQNAGPTIVEVPRVAEVL